MRMSLEHWLKSAIIINKTEVKKCILKIILFLSSSLVIRKNHLKDK